MKLLSKVVVICCAFVVLAVLFNSFVNISTRIEFAISTSAGLSTLKIYVPKVGFYFNPHGGAPSDSYTFVFPAGSSQLDGSRIVKYLFNDEVMPFPFSEASSIDLRVDGSGCEIFVQMFNLDGQPAELNGVHRMRHCGLDHL